MSEPMTNDLNESSSTPKSKPVGRILAAVVLLLALAGGGYAYWLHASVRETTDDAQVEGHIHAVSARVGGTVTKVHVENNQLVEAGTVLFEIDPRDYQVALSQAKADLAEAEARLGEDTVGVPVVKTETTSRMSAAEAAMGEIQAAIAAAQKQVEAAEARKATALPLVKVAKANADRAAADFQRMKALLAKDEISKQQYDAALAAADATHAQLEAAQSQVVEADRGIAVARSMLEHERSRIPRTQADISAAQSGPQQVKATSQRAVSSAARVAMKRAAVEAAELNLERTIVRAPVRGVVGQKSVEPGQIIQPGQSLLAVVAIDNEWVVANYKETQLASMKPGQPVDLAVDALNGRVLHGKVHSIGGATGARFSLLPAENATGNFVKVVQRVPVKIVFDKGQDEQQQRLRPGMSVVTTVLVN
jgi:membrane fusion protein (multidrug efflux system)